MVLLWNPRQWGSGEAHAHFARGDGDRRLRLTEDQVREIRALYKTGDWTFVALAERYKISPRQASNIAQYKSRLGTKE
jgi:hypothetical protein